MLEELGRLYRTELREFGTTMKAPAYLAINPMGKVPALRHGAAVVTETAGICAYLADAFPETGLASPPGDPRRGPHYRWLFFGAGLVEAAWTNQALGFVTPPDRARMAGYGSRDAVLHTREDALLQKVLCCKPNTLGVGDSFTAAALHIGAQSGFGPQFGMIEKRPVFVAYAERLAARPVPVRARETDDALGAARPTP